MSINQFPKPLASEPSVVVDNYVCHVWVGLYQGVQVLQYVGVRTDKQIGVSAGYAQGQLTLPVIHQLTTQEGADCEDPCHILDGRYCNATLTAPYFLVDAINELKQAHAGKELDPPLAFWELLVRYAKQVSGSTNLS